MENFQNFFRSAYKTLKSQLCERRNTNPVRVNRFAQLQRTDVLVRRKSNDLRQTNTQNHVNNQNNANRSFSLMSMFSSNKREDHQQQQNNNPQQQQPPTHQHKQSSYKLNTTLLQSQNSTNQIISPQEQQQQQLIQQQVKLDKLQREINKLAIEYETQVEQDGRVNKLFWKKFYHMAKGISKINGNKGIDNSFLLDGSNKELSQLLQESLSQNDYRQYKLTNNNNHTHIIPQQQLNQLYQQNIINVIETKYSRQLIDYPLINQQIYRKIKQLWISAKKYPNSTIRQMNLNFLTKLTARSFNTLSPGTWLNDQIINGYLEMVDIKSTKTRQPFKVLNSFFAQTTFAKSPQVIQRVLKRKSINKGHIIIIAINTGNHWLFAQIVNQKIIIHDSIRKSVDKYVDCSSISGILENIRKFADMFYGGTHEFEVDESYPQQKNMSDCGMFLLCGIKDIVRGYKQWSFDKNDICYKRFQVAKQLLQHELEGFNQ